MRSTILLTTLAVAGFVLAGCQSVPAAHPLPATCKQAPEAGNGQAKLTGFYYDQDSRSCKSFAYSDNGSVPFQDLGQCMAACYAPAPDLMPGDAKVSANAERVK